MWLANRSCTGGLHSLVQWEMSLKGAFLKGGAAWHGPGELKLLRHLLRPQGLQQPAGLSPWEQHFFLISE